jgi:hypothetical protein
VRPAVLAGRSSSTAHGGDADVLLYRGLTESGTKNLFHKIEDIDVKETKSV